MSTQAATDSPRRRATCVTTVPTPSAAPSLRVVLDLAALTWLDTAGVAALHDARRAAEDAGRTFVLDNPGPVVLATIEDDGTLLPYVSTRPALRVVTEPAAEHAPVDQEALVRDHRTLADRLAARFAGRGQPIEDLRQVAYLGLVMAAQRFDPAREVRFSTYAQATVIGELKRYFRDHAWQLHVARPVQELYLAVREASERLTHEIGRTPTPAELATVVGATEEQVIESLEARSALRVDSLDAPRADDDDRPWHDQAFVDDGFRGVEERSWLVPALRALPERERRILKLRFFDGMAQSAIAAEVGISQMHVSRLLARSLRLLREAAGE